MDSVWSNLLPARLAVRPALAGRFLTSFSKTGCEAGSRATERKGDYLTPVSLVNAASVLKVGPPNARAII